MTNNPQFLVKWLDEEIKPEVCSLEELKESNEWDLSEEVIRELSNLKDGGEYFLYEFGTTINFIKIKKRNNIIRG